MINKNIFYFSRKTIPALANPQVASRPFRVVIQNPDGKIDSDVRATLICDGCNFFVDANIQKPAPAATIGTFIGLIAIDDFSTANFKNQGNVYICGAVTETNLTIFADGSLYHYGRDPDGNAANGASGNDVCTKNLYTGSGVAQSGQTVLRTGDLVSPYPALGSLQCRRLIDMETGLPSFENCATPIFESNILVNQWTNYGQLFVRNTIGASTFIPPITGEGDIAQTTNLFLRARRQDINFMRWAKWGVNPGYTGSYIGLNFENPLFRSEYYWLTDIVQTSPSLGNVIPRLANSDPKTINFPPKEAVTNIFFKDSRPLPIFGELSR